jgi:hypothetical protein
MKDLVVAFVLSLNSPDGLVNYGVTEGMLYGGYLVVFQGSSCASFCGDTTISTYHLGEKEDGCCGLYFIISCYESECTFFLSLLAEIIKLS